jgi:prepilin-type N-terminal cleavage/methylation domain-containing protein
MQAHGHGAQAKVPGRAMLCFLRKREGMTLIEVMVAFVLIAIVALIAVVGFNAMASVTRKGDDIREKDKGLENAVAVDEPDTYTTAPGVGKLKFDLDGTEDTVEINGEVRIYEQDGETFRVFVPADE